jgi:putative spermidine/putrescine transport system ATP-binding protein
VDRADLLRVAPDSWLVLENLVKHFGSVRAVDGVSLGLPEGKLISFLGPSGCGKTTLLRMIAGLEVPTSGRVLVNGDDITDEPSHTRDVGMVFQSLALFPHLNVRQNIGYALRIRGGSAPDMQRRVDELLSLVDLEGLGERRITKLSGGQQQRVAMARALARDPKLFLLDEPLSALDANLREALQVELRLLQQRLHVTTVMVTHDQREAMTMSDLVVVMNHGRVEQVGPPLEVYRRPATAFVARFIGSTNLLGARVTRARFGEVANREFAFLPGHAEPSIGSEIQISVRPENARIIPPDDQGSNMLPGTVVFVRDLGESFECYVDCGLEQSIVVAGSPQEHPDVAQGDPVTVYFPPESCVVVAS